MWFIGCLHITREGVSLLGISDAAELIGLRSTGVKITWEQLRDEIPMPCIVHWNQQHFVVVYKVKNGKVYVSDPAVGLLEFCLGKLLENRQNLGCHTWLFRQSLRLLRGWKGVF